MFTQLFSLDAYTTTLERDRARLIYLTTLMLMVIFALYALFIPEERTGLSLFATVGTSLSSFLAVVSVYALGIFTLYATRRGWKTISAVGPVAMWYFSGVQISLNEGLLDPSDAISLAALILLGALLLHIPGTIATYVVAMVTIVLGYGRGVIMSDPRYFLSELVSMIFQTTGIALLVYMFLRSTLLTRAEAMQRASQDRLRLASLSTQLAQRISRRLELQDVLNVTVEQIRESYPAVYHAQIFLVAKNGTVASLVASTGEVGRKLLARQHQLGVGTQSVIGQVTSTGQAVVSYPSQSNSVHQRNELLPETEVEAAFPLRIADNIIGALDLQSKYAEAIPEADIPIFQSLADNIAIAIDNAQLAEQTAQRLQENQRLLEQMSGAMQQVERLNQQLTAQSWSAYLSTRQEGMAFTLDLDQGSTTTDRDWTPTLEDAVQKNDLIHRQDASQTTVAVPLQVRGQVIGAMEFELENGVLEAEDFELIRTIGERLGLALESARLYDESRRVAHREAMLNEIGGRLQSSNNVDGVLSEAARSLQSTLGAQRVAIRLGTPTNGTTEPNRSVVA